MDDLTALPDEADYRKYDKIWRRVSPELDPYPDVRAAQTKEMMGPRPPRPPEQRPAPPEAPGQCMTGKAAQEEIDALRGFLRDELADGQTYRYLARQAPTAEARRMMNRIASDEAAHAKRLQTAHFLITGGTYPVTVVLPPQPRLLWKDRLRERYHEETQGGAAYERAAEKTRDKCLRRMFEQMARDEYRHAELIEQLLEKTL